MENKSENQAETRSSSPTHSHLAESSVVHPKVDQTGSSSATSDEAASVTTTAFLLPSNPVPASTPTAGSVVEGMNNSNFYQATAALGQLQLKPESASSSVLGEPPTPAAIHIITRIQSIESEDRAETPKPKVYNDETPPNEHVHEYSLWEEVAKEDLTSALERAGQYAKDKVRINDARTVEDYYSEMVAEMINQAQLKFDGAYLK